MSHPFRNDERHYQLEWEEKFWDIHPRLNATFIVKLNSTNFHEAKKEAQTYLKTLEPTYYFDKKGGEVGSMRKRVNARIKEVLSEDKIEIE